MSGFGISNLPIYHEQIHCSEPQVENNYQRNADLIPNLLETAKGFSAPCKDWQVKGPFGGGVQNRDFTDSYQTKKSSKRTKKACGGN